jgi:hypothetical protein
MGPEDLSVAVRGLLEQAEYSEERGGDGLRHRHSGGGQSRGGVGVSSGSGSAGGTLPQATTRTLYAGRRKASKLQQSHATRATGSVGGEEGSGGGGGSAPPSAAAAAGGSPQHTFGRVTVIDEVGGGVEGVIEPLDRDAHALLTLLKKHDLQSYFPGLQAEALGSLPLLQAMGVSSEEALRNALKEAGVSKVGHRETLVMALKSWGGGGREREKIPGVNDGLRAALAQLAVTAATPGE